MSSMTQEDRKGLGAYAAQNSLRCQFVWLRYKGNSLMYQFIDRFQVWSTFMIKSLSYVSLIDLVVYLW